MRFLLVNADVDSFDSRMMMTLWKSRQHSRFVLILILGFFLVGIASVSSIQAEDRIEASLIVEDVLALPGKRVQLKAFLFREGLLGKRVGLGGENVEFFIQSRLIGEVMTGGDGKAYIEFVPRLRGNLTIKAKVLESPRVLDQEATGLLAAWEKRRPILLVDLEALLPADKKRDALKSLLPVTLGSDEFPEPELGAPGELEKLGKYYYNLVYLQRSKSGSSEIMRTWLRKHKFPRGIPLVVQPGPEAFISFLEKLKEDGWKNVTAGIGRTVEFAEVLLERRIQAVIIQETESEETFPRRTNIVNGWGKVRRHL